MTDLSAAAWRRGEPVEGLELAEKIPGGMKTFVLNVGSKALSNISVLDIGTGGGSGVGDGPLAIRGRLRNTGQKDQRVVSLWIDGQKKDQKAVELPADGEVDTPVFQTPKLTPGLHQLELRADSSPDSLAIDDTRYLTVDLAPPQKVLVISDRRLDADFVASALDPLGLDPGTPRSFQVDRVLAPQAADHTARLRDYAAVFLLNVAHLDAIVWTRLQSYVREGGGLVVAPGERTREGAAEYNSGTAAALLPGSIGTLRDHRAEFFTFGKAEAAHPIFAQSGTSLPDLLTQLGNVPIHRSLEVTPAKESTVLLRYQDGSPALLERTFPGNPAGHVLLWTTALARRPDPNSPEAWNEFPMPTAGWGFLVVMDQTIPYLAGTIGQKRTVEAGEDVVLAIDSSKRFTGYTLLGPETRQTERLNAPITQGSLLVSQPAQVGHWKVTATGPDGAAQTLGFSVNVPTAELDLRPMTAADLDGLLGKDKYGLATGLDELKRVQGEERVGRELFPWVMLGILVLVTIESLLANTFYKESGPGRTSSTHAAAAQPAPSAA
jgi:hypothetical protein